MNRNTEDSLANLQLSFCGCNSIHTEEMPTEEAHSIGSNYRIDLTNVKDEKEYKSLKDDPENNEKLKRVYDL